MAGSAVVIAIDAGTTGVRAFAVDESGTPCGWKYREFTQHFPEPGWVEHDAAEIWDAVQTTMTELRAELDRPVAAIGITNQRETAVVWDRRTGAPAIAPSCGRTAGPRRAVTSCAKPGSSTSCDARPASCSTPTSRPPSSSGC